MATIVPLIMALVVSGGKNDAPNPTQPGKLADLVGFWGTSGWDEWGNGFACKQTLRGSFLFVRRDRWKEWWGLEPYLGRHEILAWNAATDHLERWSFSHDGTYGHDSLTKQQFFDETVKMEPLATDRKLGKIPADHKGYIIPYGTMKDVCWLNRGVREYREKNWPISERLEKLAPWIGAWDVEIKSPDGSTWIGVESWVWTLHNKFLASTLVADPKVEDGIAAAKRIRVLGQDIKDKKSVRGWEFRDDGSHAEFTLSESDTRMEGRLTRPDGKKCQYTTRLTSAAGGKRSFETRLSSGSGKEEVWHERCTSGRAIMRYRIRKDVPSGVCIKFDVLPKESFIRVLESRGFRPSDQERCWYRSAVDGAAELINALAREPEIREAIPLSE